MADSDKGKLGLPALTALVVGGIIGSGIFSLPQNMAEGAGAGAILIAWAITFVGMLTLTRIFQWLSTTRPELDDGVYGYAREGFGEYLGFNAAWGYWISAWVGTPATWWCCSAPSARSARWPSSATEPPGRRCSAN